MTYFTLYYYFEFSAMGLVRNCGVPRDATRLDARSVPWSEFVKANSMAF
jgi:hypothetical protein